VRPYGSAVILLIALVCGCGTHKQAAHVESYAIESKAVGEELEQRLVMPEDPSGTLLVFLHGRANDPDSTMRDAFFDALDDLGDDAPAVVLPDGGFDSFWHDRDSGDWGRYVVKEVIPRALKASGANPDRVAIGGISMGGFGALDIARLNAGRFCAVGAHSPAILPKERLRALNAFDDARDYRRHDVLGAAVDGSFKAPENLWIDIGYRDVFAPGAGALAKALGVKIHAYPGAHRWPYWDDHWDEYLRFYADACGAYISSRKTISVASD
jgi:S-formylglutathione hydrolase FrmB